MTWKKPRMQSRRPSFAVWHGTKQEFDEVDFSKVGLGLHTGSEKQAAEFGKFGRMIAMEADIKNPVRLMDRHSWEAFSVWKQLRDSDQYGLADRPIIPDPDRQISKKLKSLETEEERVTYLKQVLLEAGYDGVVYLNRYEGLDPKQEQRLRKREEREDYDPDDSLSYPMDDSDVLRIAPSAHDSYIVFYPEQIKRRS